MKLFEISSQEKKTRLPSLLLFVAALWLLPACVEEMHGSILDDGSSGSKSGMTQKMFVPRPDDLTVEKATGLKVAKNVINITFKRDTDRAIVDTIISSVGGKIVGYDTPAGMYQVMFPGKSLSDLDPIRYQLLKEHKEVEAASRFFVSVYRDPYYIR